MARPNLSSEERLEVYGRLYLLNREFHRITVWLSQLYETEIFDFDRLEELRGLTQDVQGEINHYIFEKFGEIEEQDWYFFGKIRASRENLQRE